MTTFHFKMGMIEMTLAPDIPLRDVLLTVGLVVMVSVVSGFQPALKASRQGRLKPCDMCKRE